MAVEHAMFTFDDLKVNSRDDRQTRNVEKTWLLQENLTSIGPTAVKKCFLHIKHTKTTLKVYRLLNEAHFRKLECCHTLKIEKFVFAIFLFN